MDKAIAKCSENALKTLEKNDTSGQYNDDKYIYKYDILDNSNKFGITDIYEISKEAEEIGNERYSKSNSRSSRASTNNGQKHDDSNIISIQKQETSPNISRVDPETKFGNNQRRTNAKQSNNNKQNVENSSKRKIY